MRADGRLRSWLAQKRAPSTQLREEATELIGSKRIANTQLIEEVIWLAEQGTPNTKLKEEVIWLAQQGTPNTQLKEEGIWLVQRRQQIQSWRKKQFFWFSKGRQIHCWRKEQYDWVKEDSKYAADGRSNLIGSAREGSAASIFTLGLFLCLFVFETFPWLLCRDYRRK